MTTIDPTDPGASRSAIDARLKAASASGEVAALIADMLKSSLPSELRYWLDAYYARVAVGVIHELLSLRKGQNRECDGKDSPNDPRERAAIHRGPPEARLHLHASRTGFGSYRKCILFPVIKRAASETRYAMIQATSSALAMWIRSGRSAT